MATTDAASRTTTLFGNAGRRARFWLSQNVPDRGHIKKMIVENGGEVVLLEKHADVMLVDHMKKNLPPGCFSYKYVELSVRNGRLEDLEKHRAGPSAPRPMGASYIPKKGTRTDFSLTDDQILYDWLQPLEKVECAPINGNKIYQELAERFPQHSWQSWRGRYLRILRGKPRPGGGVPRPDLLHGAAPEPTRNQVQLPLTTAQSRPSITSPSHAMGPANQSAKRKLPLSPQTPTLHVEARESSPSKRRKPEISRASSSVVQRSPGNRFHPSSRTSNPAISSQVVPHTQHSHTTIHSTQSPPHTQPMHDPGHESSDDAQGQTDPNFLELPFLPPSPEPDDGEESDDEDLPNVDGWITKHLARGISDEETIIAVLRSATMDQTLADKVLENWDPNTAIPDDIPGVWTAEDDKCLEDGDARNVERVTTKHGEELTNTRWEYLRIARERGLL